MNSREEAALAKLEREGVIVIVGYNEDGRPIVRLTESTWQLIADITNEPPKKERRYGERVFQRGPVF